MSVTTGNTTILKIDEPSSIGILLKGAMITFIEFVQGIDIREILTFSAIMIIITILIILFHYSSIQQIVRNTSRCYKEKQRITSEGVYIVNAQSHTDPLFKVSYNFPAKQTSLECACNTGEVVNEFKDIPYFDLATQTSKTVNQICKCDRSYENDDITYTGFTDVVNFMYNPQDPTFTTFFKKATL